jgi:hypothetical protein
MINRRGRGESQGVLFFSAYIAVFWIVQKIIKSLLNGRAIFMSTAAVGEANDI